MHATMGLPSGGSPGNNSLSAAIQPTLGTEYKPFHRKSSRPRSGMSMEVLKASTKQKGATEGRFADQLNRKLKPSAKSGAMKHVRNAASCAAYQAG